MTVESFGGMPEPNHPRPSERADSRDMKMDSIETSVIGLPEIRQYWEHAATTPLDETSLRPTARDPYLQQLVETTVEKWIWPGARMLDIGCGDGTSTLRFANKARSVLGLDFVAEYVKIAQERARRESITNAEFACADVLNLREVRLASRPPPDIVVTIRCLINLCSWANQQIALREIAETVKRGGLYILSEGWSDGWEGLNRLRARGGIAPIELVKYNCLINRNRFEKAVAEHFDIVHYENLGFYIFMSRVFQAAYVAPHMPAHEHDINRIAANLGCAGMGSGEFRDCDYAGVYVLRRR